MKKNWIWILIVIAVLVIILFLIRKRTQATAANGDRIVLPGDAIVNPISDSAAGYGNSGSSGIPIISGTGTRCECERDPRVQDMIAQYNAAPTMLKPNLKAIIKQECPCLTYLI